MTHHAVHPLWRTTRTPHEFRGGLWWMLLLLGCSSRLAAEADPGSVFFENRIRPLLVEHCFSCHGPEKQKSGLRLDSKESLLLGGERGPAVVVGQPSQSRLLEAVAYTNADLQMPPKKKLGERQIADLARWISMGAPWPESTTPPSVNITQAGKSNLGSNVQDRVWWSFQPIRRPALGSPGTELEFAL